MKVTGDFPVNCRLTDIRGLSDAALSYLLDRVADDPMIAQLVLADDDDSIPLFIARVFAMALGAGLVSPPIAPLAAVRWRVRPRRIRPV